MNKHTPGPWKYSGDIAKHDNSHIIHSEKQKWIAAALDFNRFDRDEEVKANANLIAAAPELLEACKMACAFVPVDTEPSNLAFLLKVIAKAEGSQP